jgi:hypothetical protein
MCAFFLLVMHAPLQLGNTTCFSYIVSYHGDVLCFTHFESPLRYIVFVIVGQNLFILNSLEMSPGASILGAVCL